MPCELLCMLEGVEGGTLFTGGAERSVDALCATVYAGGGGGWALIAGVVGDAGGDALYLLEVLEVRR